MSTTTLAPVFVTLVLGNAAGGLVWLAVGRPQRR
jgi:hypothetical protein